MSGPRPLRSLLWLSFHFTFALVQTLLSERRATTVAELLPLHSTPDMETYIYFPLCLVWYRKKASTHEHSLFNISPFQMLSICWETKQNLSKYFTNSFALQQQLCILQPAYPKPSFNSHEVSLPLANPQGISWAITSCLHLEPRTHRKIYSWANIWKLHQLRLNIYIHVYIAKDCI